jgi:tRNA threonylcarbamoyladenosine biosynthesis protein TsaE
MTGARPHELVTEGPEETERFGACLGRTAQGGELLGLVGDLGAGKTCLVRGVVAGLGADPDAVHSPTFVVATEYRGGRLSLHHVDLYRLEGTLLDLDFLREDLYGPGVACVEWFDRLRPQAGNAFLQVALRCDDGDRRRISLEAYGERHRAWLRAAVAAHAETP